MVIYLQSIAKIQSRENWSTFPNRVIEFHLPIQNICYKLCFEFSAVPD